nr:vomeronasal type-1 receptor 2-like [Manis javanica]
MATKDRAMGMAFLLQTMVGILGNSSLFCHYIFLHYTGCKLRSTDLILKHLTVANLLVILSKGVPETVTAFGWSHFFSDGGCKLLFYAHKVSRDASVCITCLLSVLQVVMICPADSRWAELKAKAPRNTGTSAILCWTLNLLLNASVLVYVAGESSNQNTTKKHSYGYCYTQYNKNITEPFYIALVLFRDGFCLILIIWSSGSMVFTLYRHKQRVKYIHTSSQSRNSLPETRATQSILFLVVTFVSLNTLSSSFHIYLAVLNNPSLWLVNTSTLIAACFPTISPYILMSHDSRVPKLCFA